MDTWLLCWVVFSLLKTGHTEPGVTQTPSHQVTRMGHKVVLECDPVSGHLYFYWYRQILGQKMEFIVSFYDKPMEKSEIYKEDRFSVKKPSASYFTLKIEPTELEDSAVYFCASSIATALQRHLQPVHKSIPGSSLKCQWVETLRQSQALERQRFRGLILHYCEAEAEDQEGKPAYQHPGLRACLIYPDSAMGCRLLCYVALCLSGADPLDTAVSQTPKYFVTQMGNTRSFYCEQNLGHDNMYWYKQDSKQLLKIMFSYNNKELIINETVPSRFLPNSPDKAHLKLDIKSLEPGDSALYLCASS
ncbi:T-cell receptor beta chain V region A20.2.25 [Tupaia chinensis]|nr:T-cell receptor beta chain V region A20.2.25 [Tupaia chinensis]